MSTNVPHLGVGFGWRPELSRLAERREGLGFVEVVAENLDHGIPLSIGGSELPDPARIDRLANLARRLGSPFVSEHLCFVRAGGLDSGHLLPIPRTRASLSVVVANIRAAQ